MASPSNGKLTNDDIILGAALLPPARDGDEGENKNMHSKMSSLSMDTTSSPHRSTNHTNDHPFLISSRTATNQDYNNNSNNANTADPLIMSNKSHDSQDIELTRDTERQLSNSSFQQKRLSQRNLYPNTIIGTLPNKKLEHLDELPRLVLRNRAFHQSANKVYISHNMGARIYKLLRYNWFHVFLRWPTRYSLITLMSIWTGSILFFAVIYYKYDSIYPSRSCGLGAENNPITFAGAFAFSLETCTTVGYTLPYGVNSFFEPNCSALQIIIFFQMAWSMIFNAFLITFLYNRLGRSEARGAQVIFSNKALVSTMDDQVRFQVRLFDCDAHHPVVEAHVRFYCVMKHRPVPRPLRILQPNDELNAMLFLSFPTVASHHIDIYSLLHPQVETILPKPKGLVLRQADGYTGNRDDVICPVCGEAYGTFERWCSHVRYQQIVERNDRFPECDTHLSLDLKEILREPDAKPMTDLELLKEHFRRNVSEIICVVEGIDPMTSGTFQALQSYRYEDIVWESHSQFSPCLEVIEHYSDFEFSVDLDRYHDIVADPDAANAARIIALEEAMDAEGADSSHHSVEGSTSNDDKPVRNRRRRLKTLSNRTADSLFAAKKPEEVAKLNAAYKAKKGEAAVAGIHTV
jgi:hypothetical protein